ncbi:MAG: NAD-dependent deacylase [Phycisphaerales bacterium]|nr:NAD-dependent deacylase [Phycisphaerales bacterium]
MTTPIPAEALRAVADAGHIVVLTGAGISAESGIPTFRDAIDGFWSQYDPRDLATPEAFARDPELVTRWYDMRRGMCAAASPNAGHQALVHLQQQVTARGGRFTLLTQNIDGLHQRAGSTEVVELHGSILRWRCATCAAHPQDLPMPLPSFPASCACGGHLRPGVVWFGEALPESALEAAVEAAAACDLFMSVGTSAVVYPAAGLIDLANDRGVATMEVNRDPTPLTGRVSWALTGCAGEVLPRLVTP